MVLFVASESSVYSQRRMNDLISWIFTILFYIEGIRPRRHFIFSSEWKWLFVRETERRRCAWRCEPDFRFQPLSHRDSADVSARREPTWPSSNCFYLCSDSSNPASVLWKPQWNQLRELVDYGRQCRESLALKVVQGLFAKVSTTRQRQRQTRYQMQVTHLALTLRFDTPSHTRSRRRSTLQLDEPDGLAAPSVDWWEFVSASSEYFALWAAAPTVSMKLQQTVCPSPPADP